MIGLGLVKVLDTYVYTKIDGKYCWDGLCGQRGMGSNGIEWDVDPWLESWRMSCHVMSGHVMSYIDLMFYLISLSYDIISHHPP